MFRIFRCSYCDFESKDEQETIAHERTHVKQVECQKIHKKDGVPAVLAMLEKQDDAGEYYELTFFWDAVATNKENARKMSCQFSLPKNKIKLIIE